MKAPISWLRDYVDINKDVKEYAKAMTLSGSKVEGIEDLGASIEKVVVGKIVSMRPHPDADKLQIAEVDIGTQTLQVVTGAPNVKAGDYIPLALPGARLPGGEIKAAKLRGVESFGMMCSIDELNLTRDYLPDAPEYGVYVFNNSPEIGKDIKEVLGLEPVVEFEITSNRPDCYSILGLARESAAALNSAFRKPVITVKEEGNGKASDYVSVSIENPELCARYAARVVTDVKVEPSPLWMQRRLAAAGMRPINNIVDITNYVMLELGQPMHAFDLKCIKGNHIIVRTARKDEKIVTLDGQLRELDPSMLVIADKERAVALAGIMGGENSEVLPDTTTLLLESANFNGASVRLTSKKVGIRSEASSRFEKGLDIENAITAINRAAQLIEELGAGKVVPGIVDCNPVRPEQVKIKLNPGNVNRLLGTDIDPGWMLDLFEKLEFGVDRETMMLTVPSFRPDIKREADLAEEVARFFDYNNIVPTLLPGKTTTLGRKTFSQKMDDFIIEQMLSSGLYETYTYSFTSPKVFDKLNLPGDDKLRNAVVITNPLGEDFSIMRTTTIPQMLEVINTNYNRKVEEGRFFEISYVYLPREEEMLPDEKKILTIGMYGNTDFYDIKGIVEQLILRMNIQNAEFIAERNNPVFHPGKTARVVIGDETAGYVGEIHPDVADNFECPYDTYIAVLEIKTLVENADMVRDYKPLPRYPAVSRDIAVLINDDVTVSDIEKALKRKGGEYLEEIRLFDVYKGEQVPEGKKSVAYTLVFRSLERTLVDDEVNRAVEDMLNELKTEFGAVLR
ncbi:MAG TPA: phenylalanine--tRNA ligase subunit beta [Ruminiclostridium sp.]|jgi:phenylalanyl-tRNA synthetase beta chain|nr:phenylalanine--tRNA ligase subunit beta [Clostridiaceae bacterium]HAA25639.1 phenylalanine--tRNA ligase subunit beta [Ruminiclostridium sp.]